MNIILNSPNLYGFNKCHISSINSSLMEKTIRPTETEESYPSQLSHLAIGPRRSPSSLRSCRPSATDLQNLSIKSDNNKKEEEEESGILLKKEVDSLSVAQSIPHQSLSESELTSSLYYNNNNNQKGTQVDPILQQEQQQQRSASFPSSSRMRKLMGASLQRKGCAFCGALQSLNGGPLSKCKHCNMAAYCGEEHQKFDWKRHKPICKTVQSQLSRTDTQTAPSVVQFHLFPPNSPPYTDSPKKINGVQNPSTSSSSSSPSVSSDSPKWVQNIQNEPKWMPSLTTTNSHNYPLCSPEDPKINTANRIKFDGSPDRLVDTNDPDIQIIENGITDNRPSARITRKRPQNNTDNRPIKDHSMNSYFKTTLQDHLKTLAATGMAINQHQAIAIRLKNIADHVIKSLNEYGWAVVDNFIGITHCRHTFQEMDQLYKRGLFSEGQLMDKKDGSHSKDIRSDQIYWFDNNDERAQDAVTIRLLVSMIDSVIVHFNGLIPYKISGRSRAMIAIYPGSGTRYVKHVDNPVKDGRCITSIYYSNENWNVNEHGGMLRLYPESSSTPVNIEPYGDRLVFFWSDLRNPHEVLPVFRNRYALTIWYFDQNEKLNAINRKKQEIANSNNSDTVESAKRQLDCSYLLKQNASEIPEPPTTKPKVELSGTEVESSTAFSVDTTSLQRGVIRAAQSQQTIAKNVTEPRLIFPERKSDSKDMFCCINNSNGHSHSLPENRTLNMGNLCSSFGDKNFSKEFIFRSLTEKSTPYSALFLSRQLANYSFGSTNILSTPNNVNTCSDLNSVTNDKI